MTDSTIRVLILAAGEAERWTEPYPKQLAKVNDIPILETTIFQLAAWGLRPTIVTHNDDIEKFVAARNIADVWPPYARRWTCETLLSTSPLWGDRTIVILGDVLFTDGDLADVIAPVEHITIYHNFDIGELMAIQFNRNHHHRVEKSLVEVIIQSSAGTCRGKLWEWYNRVRLGGGIRAVKLLTSMDVDTVEDLHVLQTIYSMGQQKMAAAWAGVKPATRGRGR